MTPDRLTGLGTYQELKTLRPKRKWNFVQVNVTYATFLARRQHIVDLMYPNNTAMDLVSRKIVQSRVSRLHSLPFLYTRALHKRYTLLQTEKACSRIPTNHTARRPEYC